MAFSRPSKRIFFAVLVVVSLLSSSTVNAVRLRSTVQHSSRDDGSGSFESTETHVRTVASNYVNHHEQQTTLQQPEIVHSLPQQSNMQQGGFAPARIQGQDSSNKISVSHSVNIQTSMSSNGPSVPFVRPQFPDRAPTFVGAIDDSKYEDKSHHVVAEAETSGNGEVAPPVDHGDVKELELQLRRLYAMYDDLSLQQTNPQIQQQLFILQRQIHQVEVRVTNIKSHTTHAVFSNSNQQQSNPDGRRPVKPAGTVWDSAVFTTDELPEKQMLDASASGSGSGSGSFEVPLSHIVAAKPGDRVHFDPSQHRPLGVPRGPGHIDQTPQDANDVYADNSETGVVNRNTMSHYDSYSTVQRTGGMLQHNQQQQQQNSWAMQHNQNQMMHHNVQQQQQQQSVHQHGQVTEVARLDAQEDSRVASEGRPQHHYSWEHAQKKAVVKQPSHHYRRHETPPEDESGSGSDSGSGSGSGEILEITSLDSYDSTGSLESELKELVDSFTNSGVWGSESGSGSASGDVNEIMNLQSASGSGSESASGSGSASEEEAPKHKRHGRHSDDEEASVSHLFNRNIPSKNQIIGVSITEPNPMDEDASEDVPQRRHRKKHQRRHHRHGSH